MYKQLSPEERYRIAELRLRGYSGAEIGRDLGRHRSTISRELRRNCCNDSRYRALRAIEQSHGRRRRCRQGGRYSAKEFKKVARLLREDWSPEQVSFKLKEAGELSISHETIYRYVWREKREGGTLHKHLRGRVKQRRKRYGRNDSRGRLGGKRHISERPAEVEERKTIGHWEIDTVVGKGSKDCVVTLVERKTGYVQIGKLKDRSKHEMAKRTQMLMRRNPGRYSTVTSDNGTEFHAYKAVETAIGVTYYFATPYHSWERGSNENLNGLVRQYFPKGMNLKSVTQRQCDAVARKLNRRPRKRLGFKTPEDCFNGD